MRELLNDLETGKYLSDRDPVRRAQHNMRTPRPKRFYKEAATAGTPDGFVVQLDGRPVLTPAKTLIALPTAEAARLVADEFSAQGEEIDLITMPVMRLVNTAIDGVAAETQAVIEDILRFASSDLVCYRADAPAGLVERQQEAWDPIIDWARERLGARLYLAQGVIHVEQSREAIGAVGIHLRQREEALRLAAIHVMTALMGSALLALAVETGDLDAEAAWKAAHVDEDWNIEQWGQDAQAAARRAFRKADMMAAAGLLRSLA
jgi:chaperone required for assembly of F1-ATPase